MNKNKAYNLIITYIKGASLVRIIPSTPSKLHLAQPLSTHFFELSGGNNYSDNMHLLLIGVRVTVDSEARVAASTDVTRRTI
jgi:hypothetical protein